ncbi:thioredoxin family protein [Novosphingobium sp.]|uniref:thioredoxin family protein n=1 Tax=Novosphingobium sp. TaxID=1874826 RepID=UPI001EC79B81|nr:thioredoxin family protein [Novosphingobium sp.]MBK6801539.1 thioredoxin family protein [Novosphingobium sp.]MBK9010557.1 thioredoxin family protein [Novosphingobium sp.]
MRLTGLAPLLLALGAASPALSAPAPSGAAATETAYYPASIDAGATLDAALAAAAREGKTLLVVFGADWCHDSRSLARVLTSERFRRDYAARYALVFIDAGKPQTGQGHNESLLPRFGVERLKGTPAMFALGPDGRQRNSRKDALSWRNADSRGETAVFIWLDKLKSQ